MKIADFTISAKATAKHSEKQNAIQRLLDGVLQLKSTASIVYKSSRITSPKSRRACAPSPA